MKYFYFIYSFLAFFKPAALILAGSVLWACAGFNAAAYTPRYYPGVYEGEGRGFWGPVYLWVHINETGIAAIEILHEEDEQIGGAAMEELSALVLDMDIQDVDGVSGATGSSAGFFEALEDALRRARFLNSLIPGLDITDSTITIPNGGQSGKNKKIQPGTSENGLIL